MHSEENAPKASNFIVRWQTHQSPRQRRDLFLDTHCNLRSPTGIYCHSLLPTHLFPKTSRTRGGSDGAYISISRSPLHRTLRYSTARSGKMFMNMVRSGAGRGTSGGIHHSYVDELKAEEGFGNTNFDAENGIVVPESSRNLTCKRTHRHAICFLV
jgi:hypothetical protein